MTREPLKPERIHPNKDSLDMKTLTDDYHAQPQPHPSRDLLVEAKIVQNMKLKWEEYMKIKNTPLPVHLPTKYFNPAHQLGISEPKALTTATTVPNIVADTNLVISDDNADHRISQHLIENQTDHQRPVEPEPHKTLHEAGSQIPISDQKKFHCSEKLFTSNKCTRHVIKNSKIFKVDQETRTYIRSVDIDIQRHHREKHHRDLSVLYQRRKSTIPTIESVEGLLLATEHPPQLPVPITGSEIEDSKIGSESVNIKAKHNNYLSDDVTFTLDDTNNLKMNNEVSETEIASDPESFDKDKGNATFSIISEKQPIFDDKFLHSRQMKRATSKDQILSDEFEEDSSASSIALEVEGPYPRRATFTEEDFLTLQVLNKDFNETIQEEMETKSDQVFKSKSEANVFAGDVKTVIRTLSKESLSLSKSLTTNKSRKSDQRNFHICAKCGKLVKPGDAAFQFNNGQRRAWHKNCFVCKTCQIPLDESENLFYEGDPYCHQHYILAAHVPKCHGCEGYIFDTSYTFAAGFYWHKVLVKIIQIIIS